MKTPNTYRIDQLSIPALNNILRQIQIDMDAALGMNQCLNARGRPIINLVKSSKSTDAATNEDVTDAENWAEELSVLSRHVGAMHTTDKTLKGDDLTLMLNGRRTGRSSSTGASALTDGDIELFTRVVRGRR